MISFHELVEACKAEALSSKLYPTEAADYRWFCREYSKMFNVSPYEAMKLPPEHVVATVFEEQLESKRLDNEEDMKSLIAQVRRLEDPDYDANQEKELQDFISNVEAFESERLAKGAPIPHPKKRKGEKQKPADFGPDEIPKDAPKEGYVNLSYLENMDNEK